VLQQVNVVPTIKPSATLPPVTGPSVTKHGNAHVTIQTIGPDGKVEIINMSDSDFDEEELPDDLLQIMQMMDEIDR
jgi:hypothetical protein